MLTCRLCIDQCYIVDFAQTDDLVVSVFMSYKSLSSLSEQFWKCDVPN